MQRKESLLQRRQDLERRKKQLTALTADVYQTSLKLSEESSSLKDIIKNCRALKARLVQQGTLTAEDYPDIPLPLI